MRQLFSDLALSSITHKQLDEINDIAFLCIPAQELEYDSHNSAVSDMTGSSRNIGLLKYYIPLIDSVSHLLSCVNKEQPKPDM